MFGGGRSTVTRGVVSVVVGVDRVFGRFYSDFVVDTDGDEVVVLL